METLTIGGVSSHFVHGVEGIHNHFSHRRVNEQLHYYQDLMDQQKRGFAIPTSDDGLSKARVNLPEVDNPTRRPSDGGTPTRIPPLDRSRSSSRPASRLSHAFAPDSNSNTTPQKALPSFATLDQDLSARSQLHDEILARHGRRKSPHPSRPFDSSPDARDRLELPRLQTLQGVPDHRQHTQSLSPSHLHSAATFAGQPSTSDPASYRNPTALEPRFRQPQYPQSMLNSPNNSASSANDMPLSRAGWPRQSYSSQSPSSESTRPLSDILEKTHAQIASQHQRSDSAIGRLAGNTSQTDLTYSGSSQRPSPLGPPPDQLSPSTHHNPYHAASPHGVPQPIQHAAQPRLGPPPTTYHQYEHRHHLPPGLSPVLSSVSNATNRRRRGNLPREAVRLFKKWVEENKRYPYPNEVQKQDFERLTGLSMQQINNWFINARRRNLSERERAEMKREKERHSQSTSPHSSRPSSSHGLAEPDVFHLDGSSVRPNHPREPGHSVDQRLGGYPPYEGRM